MTALFALSQTLSAYVMSHFAQYGAAEYVQIFEIAFMALLLAALILLIFENRVRRTSPRHSQAQER